MKERIKLLKELVNMEYYGLYEKNNYLDRYTQQEVFESTSLSSIYKLELIFEEDILEYALNRLVNKTYSEIIEFLFEKVSREHGFKVERRSCTKSDVIINNKRYDIKLYYRNYLEETLPIEFTKRDYNQDKIIFVFPLFCKKIHLNNLEDTLLYLESYILEIIKEVYKNNSINEVVVSNNMIHTKRVISNV